MTGRTASFLLLTLSVVLALLLFAGVVDGSTVGWLFAVALVVLGVPSRGFSRR